MTTMLMRMSRRKMNLMLMAILMTKMELLAYGPLSLGTFCEKQKSYLKVIKDDLFKLTTSNIPEAKTSIETSSTNI